MYVNNNVQSFVKIFTDQKYIFLSHIRIRSSRIVEGKKKKKNHVPRTSLSRNDRARLLRRIQFAGITADRSERFDIPFGCDGNSPESKRIKFTK